MVNGIYDMVLSVKIGYIGLYRDEKFLELVFYYVKFLIDILDGVVLVVDLMFVMGGLVIVVIIEFKNCGVKDVRFVGFVGCFEGVKCF